jgi:hypothetical protein
MLQNQHNNDVHSSPDPNKNSIPPNERDPTRLILVCIAGFLATLSFVAFIITRNPNVLIGTSVLAYPLFRVIDYYFKKE